MIHDPYRRVTPTKSDCLMFNQEVSKREKKYLEKFNLGTLNMRGGSYLKKGKLKRKLKKQT